MILSRLHHHLVRGVLLIECAISDNTLCGASSLVTNTAGSLLASAIKPLYAD